MHKILKDLKLLSEPGKANVITSLYKIPRETKSKAAHVSVPTKGYVYQADLLYLPDDGGYKYALVVVDAATHNMDAEPLKDKSAATVLTAFKAIFKRKHLALPKFSLECDDGKEFKGPVKQYFVVNDVIMRYGKPYRHRQQSVVEWMNYVIGKVLFMMMTVDELNTGETTRDWVAELPELVNSINSHLTVKPQKPEERDIKEEMLPVGAKVRVVLEAPINVPDESKAVGKFRAGDIRWSVKPTVITQVFLRPDQPVMYAVEGNTTNAYTRQQLQLYDEGEEMPKPRKYTAENIVGRKEEKGKVYYEVKWKGYDSAANTWESRAQMLKDVPTIVEAYERDRQHTGQVSGSTRRQQTAGRAQAAVPTVKHGKQQTTGLPAVEPRRSSRLRGK